MQHIRFTDLYSAMFSKYDPCDAPAELDGLQKITPEHLHHPETQSIKEKWVKSGTEVLGLVEFERDNLE